MRILETGIDELVERLKQKKKAGLAEIADELGYSKDVVEEWAKVLEEHGIVEIKYGIRGAKLKIKHHRETEKNKAKKRMTAEDILRPKERDEFISEILCDHCGKSNELKGDPNKHAGETFKCEHCDKKSRIPAKVPKKVKKRYKNWKEMKEQESS